MQAPQSGTVFRVDQRQSCGHVTTYSVTLTVGVTFSPVMLTVSVTEGTTTLTVSVTLQKVTLTCSVVGSPTNTTKISLTGFWVVLVVPF